MEVSTIERSQRFLPTCRQAVPLYAGFWLRVAAWLIDAVILGPIAVLASALVVGVMAWAWVPPTGAAVPGYAFAAWLWVCPVVFALSWLYCSGCESSRWQATPGKRVLGLRVTDARGHRIGFARASARWVGRLASAAMAGIGYLLAGWTARKQALHDLMAGCCVVRQEGLDAWRSADATANASAEVGAPSTRPAAMPAWAVVLAVLGIGTFVAVPCVAVLSLLAMPAYHAHQARAQATQGLDATLRVRALVGEYIVQRGALPTDNRALGLPAPERVHAQYVRSVRVADGKVVVTYGPAADPRVRGGHLVISPVGNAARLRWHCASPDIASRYLPPACRD